MPDQDGYPTDEELGRIETWEVIDRQSQLDCFAYIKSCWWTPEWGWTGPNRLGRYRISTGGWSGNESIVSSMRKNLILWVFTWEQSRRGGHYIFKVGSKKRS